MQSSARPHARLRVRGLAALLASLALTALAAGQPPTAGPEFQINDFTVDRQDRPDVARDSAGGFVVVWTSASQDGDATGVFGRRFDAAGAPLASEFQVNVVTAGAQSEAAIAMTDAGTFVVAWRSGAGDGSTGDVFARRFDASATPQGDVFLVNAHTTDVQRLPAVAIDTAGNFVVVWTSERQDGSVDQEEGLNGGVFGRRFDAAGVAQASEFQVNTYTPYAQREPVVAMRGDGQFVVAWSSRLQDEDPSSGTAHDGVFAQRYSSSGAPVGDEFQVNTYTTSWQHHQAIGMDGDGDFVIAWHSDQDGSYSGIFAQRFDSSGTAQAAEFQVNTFTPDYQEYLAVAMDATGAFVVVWDSRGQDGDGYGLFGKRFDSAGAAQSPDFQVNSFTFGYQNRPAATRSIDGQFVVVWQGSGTQDGDGYGIFGKRFGVTPSGLVLDADGNGQITALTDGLLVLRWAFGFTGATLESGAIGAGCTRCTGAEVEGYLNAVIGQLDIDDDGALTALTDGLLILRFLFGFNGATLINGAVGSGCMRCEAPEIEAYLGTLVV